jgi:predicted DNA-binding protein
MCKIQTTAELESALNNKLSLLLCKTKGCAICSSIKEKLENIENYYPDINFYELNIEELRVFQGQFLIFTLPTVLVISYNKELHRESRFIRISILKNTLNKIIEELK